LENYTKYKLKPVDELTSILSDTDNIFVIACNKCFKEFDTTNEPDCAEFIKIASECNKTITGSVNVDFLCNKYLTEKKLQDIIPNGTESIFVISCGLGIQTVADIVNIPVFAASDSINYTGHHGMALTKKACDACAQCYLNITGGICPIVDCSKSLVNGQCGGAKNGKCEVDGNKDCAWEKINHRLEQQGRLAEFLAQPIQIRDYSKVNTKVINEYVKSIREERFAGYYGGVHPPEGKHFTENIPLVRLPAPEVVAIPVSMHAGAPAKPIVAVNDTVKVGQKIAEPTAFISSAIHSSVSGTVIAIEPRPHPTMGECTAIVIKSDGKNTLHENIRPNKPLEELTADEIVDIVRENGVVGMGGASFPTAVKLKPNKPIDHVLLNGCECEPLLTADHRVMLEFADDIIYGAQAILKATGAEKAIIVIEDNKADAIELMQSKTADVDNIEVLAVRTKYPQGAEKVLVKRALGRQIPSGGLPADVGVIVDNISTAKAIADAIRNGIPLIERVVTVTGDNIAIPGNFIVKIGTSAREIVEHCGGVTGNNVSINSTKAGGPMMGSPLSNIDIPILKGVNGIIAINADTKQEVPCIKCGRCVDVCPMELSPLYFGKYADESNWTAMAEKNLMDCIECGCCEHICSSKIPLVTKIRAGKKAIRGMK